MERYIDPEEIAEITGVHESQVNYRIDHYGNNGIDPSSLRYNDNTGEITAKTPGGQNLEFYVVQTGSGQTGYFGGKRDVEYLVDNADSGDAYPELAGANVITSF